MAEQFRLVEDRLSEGRTWANGEAYTVSDPYLLVFTRWVLVMNAFERALYADPEGDLDTTWWELVSRYQGITPPDGRRAPDWAAKIHIAAAPV